MPTKPPKSGKHRLQIDLCEERLKRLDYCREKLEAGSRAEVVRRALSLLEDALDDRLYLKGKDGVMRRIKVI